jgi:hypothetical protein
MYHAFVAIVALLLGGVFLYFGAKTLKRFDWFFAWIRGTVGLVFVAIAGFVLIFALDLASYRQLLSEKTVATLSFQKLDEQLYKVEVNFIVESRIENYEIRGDQWQVDARIVRWTGMLASVGAKPGYRLDRISGRYYSLEDERRKSRSVYQFNEAKFGLDTWAMLQQNDWFPLIDAVYGSATYLPMADGAIYNLSLSHNGLTAKPVNDEAEKAIQNWR